MLLTWLVGLALAQNPPPGLPPGLSFPLTAAPTADARWVTAEVVSERFPGEALPGPTFKPGEQVELIVEDGGKVRVRAGERYGWVSAASLATTAPAPAPGTTPDPSGLLGGLQLTPSGTPPPQP